MSTAVKAQPKTEPKTEAKAKPVGITPNELADTLSVSPKSLRAWLRTNYTRPLDAKNSSWFLSPEIVKAATEHYTRSVKKNENKAAKKAKK